jgi:hypothetical protein
VEASEGMRSVRGCDGAVKITRIKLLRGIKIVENLDENFSR